MYSSGHRKHWDSCQGTGEHLRRREARLAAADDEEEEVDELTAAEIEAEVCSHRLRLTQPPLERSTKLEHAVEWFERACWLRAC